MQTNSEMDAEQAYQSALKAYNVAVLQLERSKVRSQKRAIIKKSLSLNEKQSAQFWPIYDKYQSATAKINDTRLALITDYINQRKDHSVYSSKHKSLPKFLWSKR